MLNYHEPSPDKKFYDPCIHCNYCGTKLASSKEYCSDSCKQKDSVWHKDDV